MNNAVYLVLFSSASWGATLIVIRRLTSVEHVSTILVYQALAMSVIAFVPMLFVWQNPTAEGWMWMGFLGLLAMGAHSLHVRAFSMQEVSALQPIDFARFPISAIGAYFFLDEILNGWTALGAFVVFAAGAYISHREAQVNRAAKAAGLLQAATSAPLSPIIAVYRTGHEFGDGAVRMDGLWGPSPPHLYATAWAIRQPGLRPKRRQARK